MRFSQKCFYICSMAAVLSISGQDLGTQAWQLKQRGEANGARELLEASVKNSPNSVGAWKAYAEFLDRHGDAAARKSYEKLHSLSSDQQDKQTITRRLVLLNLLAGDTSAATTHLDAYRASGGSGFTAPAVYTKPALTAGSYIEIPGPLRSFARMAALSPDLAPEELLPALARNIVTNGYQAASSNESLEPTEYLKLINRYLVQARELTKLAGEKRVIQIDQCDSSLTGEVLKIIGYRMRGGCGAEVVLETVNAMKAFLTVDSGFPLAELEQALRANRPFSVDYRPTQIPVLFAAEYWQSAKDKQNQEFIDSFLSDPQLCRLYLGLAKLDRETSERMRKATPVQRLKSVAHILDFYGGMFYIENGKAAVPGAPRSEGAWGDMVGASVSNPEKFFEGLLSKDDGWLCSYFDSLLRISSPGLREYLTEGARMKRFYSALKGKVTSPGPARPVFRASTDLMLLTTRMRMDANGKPHMPGAVETWRELFLKHPHGKYDSKLTKSAAGWKDVDDVIEAMFALCRKAVENEPLKMFMALSDMDRGRAEPLSKETVDRLVREYRSHGPQYALINETASIKDATVTEFLDVIQAITSIRDQGVRADAAGSMQSLVAMWQIFVRQGSIPDPQADAALKSVLDPFTKAKTQKEVFEATAGGLRGLLKLAGGVGNAQDRLVDLLTGSAKTTDTETQTLMQQQFIRVFDAQKLISVESILALADHLEEVGKGGKLDAAIVSRVGARLSEVQLPRAGLSGVEKNALLFGYWTERHIENQRKINLKSLAEKAGTDAGKLADVRASLLPILRDSMVGLVYAHYSPPGGQIIFTNPIFVRSHDFIGMQGAVATWKTTEVVGTGWPASAGGRLVGSLAGLPYAIAEAEQNFLIPSREQALIWGDLVPQMMQSAKIPRWWNVSPVQMHYVALHLRNADSLLAESTMNEEVRKQVGGILLGYAVPARARKVSQLLGEGRLAEARENVTPAESYSLSRLYNGKNASYAGAIPDELRRIEKEEAASVKPELLSRAFGTPKPTLTNSYRPELLELRTFPTLMGYSSRILAESWESNLLYYASLADEMYMVPSQLNIAIPDWTRLTVEKIFATHLEDWPALLRSLRLVGNEARQKNRPASAAGAGN